MKIFQDNVDRIAERIVADELRGSAPEMIMCTAVRASNGTVVSALHELQLLKSFY